MNIYCDRYAVCNMYLHDRTEEQARARGWHIFHGTDQGGKPHHVTLCRSCAEGRRRDLKPPPPLQDGQRELFEILVYVPPEGTEMARTATPPPKPPTTPPPGGTPDPNKKA
jgi:hypothetical protein